jgi:hypothetical protein
MRVMKPLLMMLCLGVFVFSSPLAAKADDWNQATSMTFDKPIEIPGMVLGPGTYVFKLLGLPNNNVVQIFNADESHLYEDVLAIPAYRFEPTDKTVITFEERAKGSPEAIHEWFYPGDSYGQEFVYPEINAAKVAGLLPTQRANVTSGTAYAPLQTQSEPATPQHQDNAPTAASLKPATASTTNVPVQIAQAAAPPKPAAVSAAKAASAQKQAAKKLPKTASPVPVLILIGLLSIGASASAHVFSNRCV